jgi:hypothetical protein
MSAHVSGNTNSQEFLARPGVVPLPEPDNLPIA